MSIKEGKCPECGSTEVRYKSIYLSGRLPINRIVHRRDIGIMISYRDDSISRGRSFLGKVLWGADNGCFTNPDLNVDEYLTWLKNLTECRETCLFATAPDVVGDAVETWERSKDVLPQIRALGFPVALVAQDGIEDRIIHWDSFDCLFIGGSTQWKLLGDAFWLCGEAAP